MSLAQELAASSMSAQETFFKETVQKFTAECKHQAARGFCSCTMRCHKPSYVSQESLEILAHRLHELGLVDVYARDCGLQIGPQIEYIELTARWKLKPAEPEKTGKGTSSTCPVCFENGPVVALTPCGHVVCKQCQAAQRFRQCPMCRQVVTGATTALFL
ncbi:unnamed protein product [Cladocopium goreaui]|uniref:ERAD-associated E3 ubiquitin-protein ligase DOA10 n=1 Tax=Cladocopium goreaui TaxID=2562237 RepID=A0A9P1G6X0_9DINO|nr:unnamed protein product [Cladocopium goreaui]|mmetsp:Transcript_21846/g.45467  ORF Transcript_21846/g.45467 Transcript_21846/m.45467 type:complete len:160 (-) Transcript_21846:225-704(-)